MPTKRVRWGSPSQPLNAALFLRYAQKKADEMKAISLQSALDTVESLEIKLTDFAKKHQSEIQNDPVFRQRYVAVLYTVWFG